MHLTVVGRGSTRVGGGSGRNASAVRINAPVRRSRQSRDAKDTTHDYFDQQLPRPCSVTPYTEGTVVAAAAPVPAVASLVNHSHQHGTPLGLIPWDLVPLQLSDQLESHQVWCYTHSLSSVANQQHAPMHPALHQCCCTHQPLLMPDIQAQAALAAHGSYPQLSSPLPPSLLPAPS